MDPSLKFLGEKKSFYSKTHIVHFFSSVAHVYIPGAKTSGPIVKKVFLKSNFYVSENFKFQCDPFSNKKDVSQRSSCCQKWHILFLDIFQLGTSVDGQEQIIT
jgi:hypothetical protein